MGKMTIGIGVGLVCLVLILLGASAFSLSGKAEPKPPEGLQPPSIAGDAPQPPENAPPVKEERGRMMRNRERGEEHRQFNPGMPPVSREEIYDMLKEHDPERLERLQMLERENPEAFRREVEEISRHIMKLKELKERDPARYEQVLGELKAEKSIKDMARKYRQTQTTEEKEALKKQMKSELEKLFDMREAQRENEIKRLEEEVNKLREKMKKRKSSKDKIIEKRLKEMTGEEEDLGW